MSAPSSAQRGRVSCHVGWRASPGCLLWRGVYLGRAWVNTDERERASAQQTREEAGVESKLKTGPASITIDTALFQFSV